MNLTMQTACLGRHALHLTWLALSSLSFPQFNPQGPAQKQEQKKYPYKKVLDAAGITDPSITFHSWRHTFRTRLAEAGVSDDLAKRLGGWTNDKIIERYDHADKTDEIRRAIESTVTSVSSAPRP